MSAANVQANGHDQRRAELIRQHAAASKAADWTKAQASLSELLTLEQPVGAFEKQGVNEIFAPLAPINWLVQGLDLCPGAPALVAGYGFSGKTVAVQDLGVAIAAGEQAWKTFTVRTGRVLHIDYEQGKRLTNERYQRIAAGRMLTPGDLTGLELVTLPKFYLEQPGAELLLARECDGYALVIIDSLRAATPSIEENDSKIRIVLDMLTRVSEATGAVMLVIHHARKPSGDKDKGGARMAIRGSGAIYDACSSVLVFEGSKNEPTRVCHEKARTSGRLADDFLLRIEDAEVDGNPRGGLAVTAESCQPADAPSAAFRALMERVVEDLRVNGHAASKSALAARVKGKVSDKFAAIDQLVSDGRIKVTDKRHEAS